jgi:hypothetical protein
VLPTLDFRRFAIAWLAGSVATVALLAIVTGLTLTNHGWWGYLTLAREGVATHGTVDRTEPRHHCLAEYVFTVEGRQHRGGAADCSATVGQEVVVTYLPDNPNLSCLGAAGPRLNNELVTFMLAGILLPPIMILSSHLQRRRAASVASPPNPALQPAPQGRRG